MIDTRGADGPLDGPAPGLDKPAPKPDGPTTKLDAPPPPPHDSKPPPDSNPQPDTKPWPLFSDDFSSSGNFSVDQGSWSVAGGMMKQTACSITPDSMVNGKSWGDIYAQVRLRADVACSSYQQAGLVVRVKGIAGCSGNQYYWCLADFDNEQIRIGKMNGNCTTGQWSLKDIPAISTGLWYWMRFVAKGKVLTCKLWRSGYSVQTHVYTDTSSTPHTSGSAGMITAGMQASFDDFSVWAN